MTALATMLFISLWILLAILDLKLESLALNLLSFPRIIYFLLGICYFYFVKLHFDYQANFFFSEESGIFPFLLL
jgi:hypothetical protein